MQQLHDSLIGLAPAAAAPTVPAQLGAALENAKLAALFPIEVSGTSALRSQPSRAMLPGAVSRSPCDCAARELFNSQCLALDKLQRRLGSCCCVALVAAAGPEILEVSHPSCFLNKPLFNIEPLPCKD